MIEDCISRKQAIDKMQELEDEDIKLYGCSIPEGFDGKRAIEALNTIPSIQQNWARDNIHFPDFNNCKWIFDFNSEVQRTITINTEVLATLAAKIDILERKLAEYERNTRKSH